ncbi:hypothetical protein A1Q2_05153 [Trichosporon asahii var. asahii CBS 8904]|uniref:Methyltransferase domain-containing protein n=2 Tax=Trichosporon asahii var. asahii TaxID=189963 RepID=K1VUN2_TRIAC|nr:hypothetical protein A1Q1_06512 [Trichosporon asahii var. asahii CBS 2479]EJT45104.1 hypothetical protein A1Q1_06512 [Trichosporon asahii var. asahii CBS 2479]EKD00488.1 hypothetical protein A1Q2_05153 [Trichosporon asahii var. asahii CBS 8904]
MRKVEENLPATNEGYGTREYCGTRRAWRNSCGCWEVADDSEGPEHNFDWFLKPDYLLPIFEELTADIKVGKDARILMLGCGNSQLSEVMYDAGWTNIVNVDYSTACIEQMTQRHGEARPKMTWLEMDVMNLTFGDEEFDMVVDKGKLRERGTADGQERWSERIVTGETNPSAMLTTKGDPWPHFRKRYLQDRAGWKLSTKTIGPPEGFDYFQYLLEWEPESA